MGWGWAGMVFEGAAVVGVGGVWFFRIIHVLDKQFC